MASSTTNLGGWEVGTEQFLGAVLKSVAQPIWAVDTGGLIRFANLAAVDALGYDNPIELLGRPSHQTIHYRRPDGSPFPASACPLLLPRSTGEAVSSELDWFIRRDGSMVPVSYTSRPIDMPDGRGAVVAFTDITERLEAEQVLHERERALRERDSAEARAAELSAVGQRVIAAADAARRQVTRDLHDGAQQRFVNAVIKLQLGRSSWEDDPSKAQDLVDAALGEAQAGLEELRELVAGIHPSILTNRGLRAAVEELVRRTPLQVDLRCDISGRLPEPIEVSVYFFVSEALANAVKHADASKVTVSLVSEPDAVVIDVADDGIGGVTLDSASGTGLGGLADRVTAFGGLLVITSPPGEGTALRAEIPPIADQTHPRPRRHTRLGSPDTRGAETTARPHDAGHLRVIRSGEGPVIEGGAISGTILGRFDTPSVVGELHAVPLPPGLRQVSGAHPSGVRELVHIHRGTVRVGPAVGPVELRPGDCADYAADVPHLYEVVGNGAALMTVLMLRFGEPGPLP